MVLADAAAWQTAWATVPAVKNDSWKANLANKVDSLVTGLLTTNGLFKAPGQPALTFTFAKSTFQGALTDNKPATLANAFETAILASTYVVPINSFIGTDTPATKFSAVASCVVDPASVALAKAKFLEIVGLEPVKAANKSQFPVKLRDAFLLLTVTTTGTNSVAPTPSPLTDPGRALQ